MERRGMGVSLRVALVSYDVKELRVWHQYLVEQCPEILCSEYRSGAELLMVLRQKALVDVVVLGGELEDMDSMEFLARMARQHTKPLVLLQDRRYHPAEAATAQKPDGDGYLLRQSSLKEMLHTLLVAKGVANRETPEEWCNRLLTDWGVSPAESSGQYLVEAVAVRVPADHKPALRKEILQTVADNHGMKLLAVDSSLRRLVDDIEARDTPEWRSFKKANGLAYQKPTVCKLVMTMRARLVRDRNQPRTPLDELNELDAQEQQQDGAPEAKQKPGTKGARTKKK